MILERTWEPSMDYDYYSSEWLGHNVLYVIPATRDSTANVNLEKGGDNRGWVRGISKVMEFFGWE